MPDGYNKGTYTSIFSTWGEKHAPVLLPTDKLIAPPVGIFDAPTRCYTINKEWAPIVIGMASLLTDIKMWAGAEDESFDAIQQVMDFLVGEDCGMIDCSQILACINDDSSYQAVVNTITTLYDQSADVWYESVSNTYVNQLQDVWPSIPATAPSTDSTDDFILCAALTGFITGFAANKHAAINDLPELQPSLWETIKNVALEVAGFFYGWFKFLVNQFYGDRSITDAKSALTDQLAMIDAACCLYNQLRLAPVNETAWYAAIDACKNTLIGNANSIIDMLALSDRAENGLFFTFGQLWSDTIALHATGASLYCPCQNEFVHTFDFASSPDGWTAEVGGGSYGNGRWVSGLGFLAVIEGDGAARIGCEITIPGTATYGIRWVVDVVGSVSAFNKNTSGFIDGTFAGAPIGTTEVLLSDTVDQTFTLPISPAKNCTYFRLRAAVFPTGSFERLVIKRATIRGTGQDPF